MADFHKIGLQIREWVSENLAPKFLKEGGAMSLTPLPPPPPPKSAPVGHIFALLARPWMVLYLLS